LRVGLPLRRWLLSKVGFEFWWSWVGLQNIIGKK
jgi:hypothetical protein